MSSLTEKLNPPITNLQMMNFFPNTENYNEIDLYSSFLNFR